MPYLEDVLLEDGDKAFDPAKDIREVFEVSGTQPGGGDSFSLEGAEAVLVYLIDWRKARAFLRWCLGFSYADSGFPYKLHRENPQYHPRFPTLTASTVHLASVAPKANKESGAPENAPNYPAVFVLPNALVKTGYYDSCFATVRFVRRPWDFRPDEYVTQPADELDRNCFVVPTPTVELLNAEGGTSQLVWQETSPAAPPVLAGPTVGEPIANLFATRVSKVRLLLNWMWVPESYLSNDSVIFSPDKLLRCVGRVNSKPFLGRPAGTLLCDAPKMDRFQFPVSTFDGLGAFFAYNVQLPITYFNPTLGVPEAGDPLLDDTKARGHRCLPWRANGKWYGATREDPSERLLEEADFNVMLQHIGA